MIVTEEEAKTKDCPTQGRDKCTASECMLWRFESITITSGDQDTTYNAEFITDKGSCKLGRD